MPRTILTSGFLPWGDYGRRALVISASTDSLVQTPELRSDHIVHRELREIHMAEYVLPRSLKQTRTLAQGMPMPRLLQRG